MKGPLNARSSDLYYGCNFYFSGNVFEYFISYSIQTLFFIYSDFFDPGLGIRFKRYFKRTITKNKFRGVSFQAHGLLFITTVRLIG